MLFLLIGIIAGIITYLWLGEMPFGRLSFSGCIGMIICSISFCLGYIIIGKTLTYKELPTEIYCLKEINDNNFYELSADGESVICYVTNNNGIYKMENFPSKSVTFVEGEMATLSITKEALDWSEDNKLWFLYIPDEPERITSIVITIPKDTTINQ